ncbi:complement C5-like isoform X1 [Neofelis nebulosa]|uniref:complement C5-like isoform X1 n=1 Tax=Neofelis nebulosa TaxID=61452 RepID=UPI00272A7A4D|nr:complement C5-like isoform X1 [Neofelis nebulosa]
MDILSVVCIFFYLGKSWAQEQTYVVSAPKVFYVGASENVVIQVHGYTDSFAVTIALKSYPDKSFTYSSGQVNLSPENKFQSSVNLTIQPKDLSGGPNAVSYIYLEVVCDHFSKATKIPLRYDNGFILIQTDKSVYNSHESVKVRIYSLDEDLKPSQREVTITFIDPAGSEVPMVGEKNYTGIITFPDFKIPFNPKYGSWTIKAKYKEDFTTTAVAMFEVKSHDLHSVKPHFFILVEPENYFISHKNFEDFKITIKARYSYNENVTEAKVSVFFGIREDLHGSGKEMMHEATQKTELIDGVAQINFNTSRAIKKLSYKSLEDLNNKYLNIFVEVQESTGTFFQETKMTDIKYVVLPYTLDLVATPLFLKPGIQYCIKVQVKDASTHFVGGIAVILKAKTVGKTQEKRELDPIKSTTNYNDGVASFVVNIPSDVTTLEFNVRTDDPDIPEEYQASNDYQAVAYSSHSQSFLSLSWTDSHKSLLVGEHLSITITPKSPYVDKITHYNYLISSKSKIIHFGTEKKLPGSSYQLLNLSVTQHMVPTARLLVYYIVTGQQITELVSDSVCLNIEEKCSNQLQIYLSPNKDIYSPGETVSLTMETQSESWVALSSVSRAINSIQERSKNNMERILQSFDKSGQDCGGSGGRNNAEVFDLAGLTVLTNANGDDSQQDGGLLEKIPRSRRELKEKIESLASTFKHPLIQKCCYDGAFKSEESCEQRAAKITLGPRCSRAFSQCCELASKLREETSYIHVMIGRHEPSSRYPIMFERSIFLENGLWEVHHVSKRHQIELTLPDSLPTWEIQGVGISNQGLCVADVLQLQVHKDSFLVGDNNMAIVN